MSAINFTGNIVSTLTITPWPNLVLAGAGLGPNVVILPRIGLKAIIASILGIDTFYAEEPAEVISPVSFGQATLTIRPGRTVGVDEFRNEKFPTYLLERLACLRSFTLSVKVETIQQGPGGPVPYADDFLETLRTRLRRDSVRQQLHALNMALETFEDIVKLPASYDTRVISAANLDINFAWAFNDTTDANAGGGGWVDSVASRGTLTEGSSVYSVPVDAP